jgi:hypothetical protein
MKRYIRQVCSNLPVGSVNRGSRKGHDAPEKAELETMQPTCFRPVGKNEQRGMGSRVIHAFELPPFGIAQESDLRHLTYPGILQHQFTEQQRGGK